MHADIWGNEEADKLAKIGLNSSKNNLDVDSKYNNSQNRIRIVSYWRKDDTRSHKIDSKLRKFIKHIDIEKHQIEWSTNRAIKDLRFGVATYSTKTTCLR